MNTRQSKHSPARVAAALRVFITSGSADGDEAMRRYLLARVDTFAAAPVLLDALERVLREYLRVDGKPWPADQDKRPEVVAACAAIARARRVS